MRVAVVTDMLRATGANIMAVNNARILSERGHDVLLLSGSREDPSIESLLAGLAHDSFLAEELVLDDVDGVLRYELGLAAEAWVVQRLREFGADVAVCHNTGRILDQLAVARISQSFPVAVVLHGEWFLTDQHYVTDPARPTQTHFEPARARSPRDHDFSGLWHIPATAGQLLAIAPSEWLLRRWRRVFPTLPGALVHNPVDPALFDIVARSEARKALGVAEDVELVGFVGDPNHHRKGFAALSDAVATLPDGARPCLLVTGGRHASVGDRFASHLVPDGPALRHLAVRHASGRPPGRSADDTVVLPGMPRDAFRHVYGAVDLLVHPSKIENLPTVPIEAGYCGAPCLVSDVGGSRETVAHSDQLFPLRLPPEALGERIRAALDRSRAESPEDKLARREATLARFSPSRHYAQLLPLLTELAA